MPLFHHSTQETLANRSGQDLFAMSRGDLEALCGKDEGSRLDSQLTVQKNCAGVSDN